MTYETLAGPTVDGLNVSEVIPNRGSIASTLTNYEILDGVRVVPMSDLDANPKDLFYAADDMARVKKLAEQIRQSGFISPLIIVVDAEGPYVLEGAHRLGALFLLGKTEFPALVVIDNDDSKVGSAKTAMARTLYHGTSAKRAESIKKHGIWPSVGEFVSQFYAEEPVLEDEDDAAVDLEPLVFMADKENLQVCMNAMAAAIGAELGKSMHDVTELEIRNRGALCVLREGAEYLPQATTDDVNSMEEIPPQVEPGDYYSDSTVHVDYILTGAAMMRFLKRFGCSWGEGLAEKRQQLMKLLMTEPKGDLGLKQDEDAMLDFVNKLDDKGLTAEIRKRQRQGSAKTSYLVENVSALKRYLEMSDEDKGRDLAINYPDMFQEWAEDHGQDGPIDDIETYAAELPDDMARQFFDHAYDLVANDPDAPTYVYMDYSGLIKDQWLIHFTDEAYSIAQSGFTKGVDDLACLGLTTAYKNDSAMKAGGGYNFAFRLQDFMRFGRDRGRWKYGHECVVFRASGVLVWHHGDEEYQVIFEGRTAHEIIPLVEGNDGWEVVDWRQRNAPLFANEDLSRVVDWLHTNYDQYRRQLVKEPGKQIAASAGTDLFHSTFFTHGLKILRDGFLRGKEVCFTSDPNYLFNPGVGVNSGFGLVFDDIEEVVPFNFEESIKDDPHALSVYRQQLRSGGNPNESEFRIITDKFPLQPHLKKIIILERNLKSTALWTWREATRAAGFKTSASPNKSLWQRAFKEDALYANTPRTPENSVTPEERKELVLELVRSVYAGPIEILAERGKTAASDDVIGRVIERLSNSYVEQTWITGQCANLAFGISLFLSDEGVKHQIKVDDGGNHVWVQVGRKILDADRFGIAMPTGKSVVIDRDKYINDPAAFTAQFGIALTPSRIQKVYKDFKKAITKTAKPAPALQALAQEFMSVLDPDGIMTIPSVNVVTRQNVDWGGLCTSLFPKKDGYVIRVDSRIDIQSWNAKNDVSARRIVAHECCHHSNWWRHLVNVEPEVAGQWFQSTKAGDGHGPEWEAEASLLNSVYGANFVTKTSDQSYERNELPPVYVFLAKYGDGKIGFMRAVKPSQAQVEFMQDRLQRNPASFKVVKVPDNDFILGAPAIGDRYNVALSDDGIALIQGYWNNGEDVSQQILQKQFGFGTFYVVIQRHGRTNQLQAWALRPMTPSAKKSLDRRSVYNEIRLIKSKDQELFDSLKEYTASTAAIGTTVAEVPELERLWNEAKPFDAKVASDGKKNHEFGCVMLLPPQDIAESVLELGRKLVQDDEVYEDPEDSSFGRETTPHTTALWGIKPEKVRDRIKKVLEQVTPREFRLMNVTFFDDNENYDVVKFDLAGEDLFAFHDALLEEFPDTKQTYEFHPHMTIAYVLKGKGAEICERAKSWEGLTIPVRAVDYSRQDGVHEYINIETPKVAKFKNQMSMNCAKCGGAVRPALVRDNPRHHFNPGIEYSCRCGAAKIWANSIRNEDAFKQHLEAGTLEKYYQGFCNDSYCGHCNGWVNPVRNGWKPYVDLLGCNNPKCPSLASRPQEVVDKLNEIGYEGDKYTNFVEWEGKWNDFEDSTPKRLMDFYANYYSTAKTAHPNQWSTPAFDNWFRGSKAIEPNGDPKKVYHGTTADFEAFDPAAANGKRYIGGSEDVLFFTDNPEVASGYAGKENLEWSEKWRPGGRVIPVYLRLLNPLIVDAKNENWQVIVYKKKIYNIPELVDIAKREGRDGLIVKRVKDLRNGGGVATTYAVFNASQVKSAIGNSGAFDTENPSVVAKEAAEPNKFMRGRIYYHGTNEANARKILQDGFIKPWDVVGKSNYEGALTPAANRSYLTPDIDQAIHYAGPPVKDYTEGARGYIFEINGTALQDIVPDEDAILNILEDIQRGSNTTGIQSRHRLKKRIVDWLAQRYEAETLEDGEHVTIDEAKVIAQALPQDITLDILKMPAVAVANEGHIQFMDCYSFGYDNLVQLGRLRAAEKPTDLKYWAELVTPARV